MNVAFVPFRLQIEHAPQYIHFPLNVLCVSSIPADGKPLTGRVLIAFRLELLIGFAPG